MRWQPTGHGTGSTVVPFSALALSLVHAGFLRRAADSPYLERYCEAHGVTVSKTRVVGRYSGSMRAEQEGGGWEAKEEKRTCILAGTKTEFGTQVKDARSQGRARSMVTYAVRALASGRGQDSAGDNATPGPTGCSRVRTRPSTAAARDECGARDTTGAHGPSWRRRLRRPWCHTRSQTSWRWRPSGC